MLIPSVILVPNTNYTECMTIRSDDPEPRSRGKIARKDSPGFSGWRMLLIASIAVFLSGTAQTYGVSAFVNPMIDELGGVPLDLLDDLLHWHPGKRQRPGAR